MADCCVWRSGDGGRSWDDITLDLPSTFGLPICVHPREPETVWTMPLNGDTAGRFPPGSAAAVWRSKDGGETWQAMRDGLPQEACYFTVLRQAMARDERNPVGVYFGLNSGSVFASVDEGRRTIAISRSASLVLAGWEQRKIIIVKIPHFNHDLHGIFPLLIHW
jgi:photosystem II stability/assembly factor-like uncharacterized protein